MGLQRQPDVILRHAGLRRAGFEQVFELGLLQPFVERVAGKAVKLPGHAVQGDAASRLPVVSEMRRRPRVSIAWRLTVTRAVWRPMTSTRASNGSNPSFWDAHRVRARRDAQRGRERQLGAALAVEEDHRAGAPLDCDCTDELAQLLHLGERRLLRIGREQVLEVGEERLEEARAPRWCARASASSARRWTRPPCWGRAAADS